MRRLFIYASLKIFALSFNSGEIGSKLVVQLNEDYRFFSNVTSAVDASNSALAFIPFNAQLFLFI